MTDRPVLGILLMLGFCVLAPLGDAMAKLVSTEVSITQVVLIRFGVQALILIPLALMLRRSLKFGGGLGVFMLIRSLLHVAGLGLLTISLRYLPLADAVAILFVMPFIVLLLGWLTLGEEVGPRRLIACAVGFVGTLLVIQPSFAEVGWPALLPLCVALIFAVFMLMTRRIARDMDPIALQAISGAMATGLIGLVFLVPALRGNPEIALIEPATNILTLLVLMGVIGSIAHLLITWSLRFAPASTLAPMQYLEIPVATILGFLIFSDWPNNLAMTGIAITVSSGLYVIWREHQLSRAAVLPAPSAPV